MGFLDRITHRAQYLDVRHHSGLGSHAIETAEYLGASYLAARANTQYGESAKWRGVEITFAGGILGKLLAVLADVAGYGGAWVPHLNTVSMALIATHLAAKGAADGLEAATSSAPALPAKRQQALGAIPLAPTPGKFLNLGEVQRVANMHG